MRAKFFHGVTVLSFVICCYGLGAQSTTDPPAFSFSSPKKMLVGASAQPGRVMLAQPVDVGGNGITDLPVLVNYIDSYGYPTGGYEQELLMGDGKGGFTPRKTNSPSWAGPFVDVNRDHIPDDVVFTPGYYIYDPENGCEGEVFSQLEVYLGDGQGNFTANPSSLIQGMQPASNVSTAVGDFNHDGLPDVAMLTYYDGECGPDQAFLYMLLNNGDGTFTSVGGGSGIPIFINGDSFPTNLVAGDFNGDGKLDLAFLGNASGFYIPFPIQVLYGNGDGSFQIGPIYRVDTEVGGMLAADLNGDGRTDLVIYAFPQNKPNAPFRVATLLAKHSGGFYWASEVDSPILLLNLIELIDLNNDGKLDLPYLAYDPSTKTISLMVFPGLGGGKFGAPSLIRNLAPNEVDWLAPLKEGGPVDIFYSLSYPPNKNIYLYEMLNQSK